MLDEIISRFTEIIDKNGHNENEIQAYMEEYTEFIPIPFTENHGLAYNAVISKLKIGERICDFAYITKSSIEWVIVFIELESSNKTIFRNSGTNIENTSVFTGAIAQIDVWREYLDSHQDQFRDQIKSLLNPPGMNNNKIRFEYVLVIGRDKELEFNQARTNRLQLLKCDKKIHTLTYDSIIRGVKEGRYKKKALMTRVAGKFHLKSVQAEPKFLFIYTKPENLSLSNEAKNDLISIGYEIDKWENNISLEMDEGKLTKETYANKYKDHPGVRGAIAKASQL